MFSPPTTLPLKIIQVTFTKRHFYLSQSLKSVVEMEKIWVI